MTADREITRRHAGLLDRLKRPELDVDETDDEDLRHLELRRVVLEVAELDHAQEIALVRAAVARFGKAGQA
ncbi:hypothetical protein OWR29_16675 [Actinoplanes sp. Pm04-4]|uniref:Uncharacterized protein n=1 Tax=Paractinoplanes pyxinae TaxID=2997416 RepID=A0ABT4AZG1_9ACTN|nr:hypothetical protein [Actinoplanes pyxinae]MCY1139636.1 hypothetical protein [Actinoplanes pyxinae]